jgi:hypothetical protein
MRQITYARRTPGVRFGVTKALDPGVGLNRRLDTQSACGFVFFRCQNRLTDYFVPIHIKLNTLSTSLYLLRLAGQGVNFRLPREDRLASDVLLRDKPLLRDFAPLLRNFPTRMRRSTW